MTVINNAAWQDRKNTSMARGEGNLASLFVERALNSEVWDVEGKRYIDFGSGIAVCNTGHTHPKVTQAVHDQIDRFSHTCVMVTPYDSAVQLAEALNELAPGRALRSLCLSPQARKPWRTLLKSRVLIRVAARLLPLTAAIMGVRISPSA